MLSLIAYFIGKAMASLTIRKLDEAIKVRLRLRSAKNGRSVEEEVRVILRETIQGRPEFPASSSHAVLSPPAEAPSRAPRRAAHAADQGRVTLIIGGGIAAYKALDLIRRLKERHLHVRCVLTKAAQHFVTPLTASALSNERAYTDLFDPESEFDAGHIRLARDCDLIVVAPATADLMAKMAQGHADDLASAILLAASRPILLAPAMNPLMWNNALAPLQCGSARTRRRRHGWTQCRRNGRSRRGRCRPDGRAPGNSGGCRALSAAAPAAPAGGQT